MSARKVFGRLVTQVGDKHFKFELHKDGLHVRQSRCKTVAIIPLSHLSRFVQHQLEFLL